MRIHIPATLLAWLFLTGTALAEPLAIIRTDSTDWPTTRVVVATEAEDSSARDYTLTLPSGKTLTANRVTELDDGQRSSSMVVALDTSRSLSPRHLAAAKDSLTRYVDRLDSDEQISLLGFNDTVELVIGFTADRDAFKSTLSRVELGGQKTELYRAMLYGIENLKNIPGRRTLLVITDGKDEGTNVTPEQVVAAAREGGVRILAIGLPVLPGKESETYLPKLESLARETGGVYRSAGSSEELGESAYTLMVENRTGAARVYELEFALPEETSGPLGAVSAELSRQQDGDLTSTPLFFLMPASMVPAGPATPEPSLASLAAVESADRAAAGQTAEIPAPRQEPAAQPVDQPAGQPGPAADSAASSAPAPAPTPAPAPAPAPAKKENPVWPWILAALLALLLIRFLVLRKRAVSPTAAALKNSEQVPLEIDFPDLGVSFPLRPGTMVMGSGPLSDIPMDDPSMPEAHVEFCTGTECTLRTLSGSYGVMLNGRQVEHSARLAPGDTLTFGSTKAVIKRADS